MSIITLTTDFGTKDYTAAAVKGRILSDLPTGIIVDISHEITPYSIIEAAFILKAAYPNFPKNSIHIIGIEAEKTTIHRHLIAKIDGHFFIAADNGIFSLLGENQELVELIEIDHPKSKDSSFPVLDVFVDVATEIANGTPLENIGSRVSEVQEWIKLQPNISKENELIGHIVYVDRFGNLITDISKELFEKHTKNTNFEIIASIAKINKIHTNYSSFVNYSHAVTQRQKAGKAMAIFNSLNFLEISLFKSNPEKGGCAASLLGLQVGDSIKITY